MTKRDMLLAAALAVAVGLIEPCVELAWKCRGGFETTEACVWGRAYFRVTQVLTPLLLSPLLFGAWFVLTKVVARK
jgi:hypothetical protein